MTAMFDDRKVFSPAQIAWTSQATEDMAQKSFE